MGYASTAPFLMRSSGTPGKETIALDAAIKLPEGAVASARPVRPAQGSMGRMGGSS